jgi:HPt (histidine-containing phosphotransfer) domain-containing protein
VGSKELYYDMLANFYAVIDEKISKMEKCVEDNMVRDYTIEVHALKNTARMIGAYQLSDMFAEMEHRGDNNDVDYIRQKNPELMEYFASFKEVLKPYGEAENDKNEAVSKAEFDAMLDALIESVNNYDIDGMDAAMKQIKTVKVPANCIELVNRLRSYVADVAMEDIIKCCEKLKREFE